MHLLCSNNIFLNTVLTDTRTMCYLILCSLTHELFNYTPALIIFVTRHSTFSTTSLFTLMPISWLDCNLFLLPVHWLDYVYFSRFTHIRYFHIILSIFFSNSTLIYSLHTSTTRFIITSSYIVSIFVLLQLHLSIFYARIVFLAHHLSTCHLLI